VANVSWLTVEHLKLLLADGGMLDLDDRISEVIDDKEQVCYKVFHFFIVLCRLCIYRSPMEIHRSPMETTALQSVYIYPFNIKMTIRIKIQR